MQKMTQATVDALNDSAVGHGCQLQNCLAAQVPAMISGSN
jgi:hypothetical protein